ncbi:FAD-binding protein [Microbacterium terricola]|uniref:3-oxosteroid 1-dehydrogenase n=1 Tax=Microbacterium terricola TaxID=344163 RepID=A0ABM8DV14_9MICO|nr:FAD-binding protein [Microbacterium terricola]UYK39788.1 FAD-binding protein [Microbacterium terricola]BDV29461.1 3-oxosteroid 1-dehydrogenase [Microbacterium terricola]
MTEEWDREVDVLIAGTGAAGMVAAITAADAGLETLIVESTGRWGGTTMRSGGGLWLPDNPVMRRRGIADSRAEALTYLEAAIGPVDGVGPASSQARREAFVDNVAPFVELTERLGVRWSVGKDYPDYYPDRPGGKIGRSIEVVPIDAHKLGDWQKTSRIGDAIPVPLKNDDVWLLSRAWSTASGFVRGAQFVFRTLAGLLTGRKLVGMGGGLMLSLGLIVKNQGTELLLDAPLTRLVKDADGTVVGAVVATAHGDLRVRARRGVILGAGGFAHHTAWREEHHGISGFTSAAEGDLGTAIAAGAEAGGALALMDDAWWGASVPIPGKQALFVLNERSDPFSIVVDQTGARYLNESESYIDFGHHLHERNETVPANPSWLITDRRHKQRYMFAGALMGGKAMKEQGIIVEAPTLDALAERIGLDRDIFRATVARFNGFAATGVDEDFGRGRTAYDRYYSDPRVKPNPNLGPIEKGPFRAIQLVPGDLGTKGGLLTDEHGRVLDDAGEVIAGLYAAGNTTASVMGRTYPGPGSTIGPAAVFGYLAARHAAAAAEPVAAADDAFSAG